MSSPLAWILGFFFVVAIGLTDARNSRIRRIIEYENDICEPGKDHLDVEGCARCVCRDHGYGSDCELSGCDRRRKRPIGERECTPFSEFTTVCHYCKCSPSGIPISCVEKNRKCMDGILEDLDYEKLTVSRGSMESDEDYYSD